jgi:hypothetical protein
MLKITDDLAVDKSMAEKASLERMGLEKVERRLYSRHCHAHTRASLVCCAVRGYVLAELAVLTELIVGGGEQGGIVGRSGLPAYHAPTATVRLPYAYCTCTTHAA